MIRRVSVTILSDRTDVHNPHIINIRLRLHGLYHILCGCDIDLQGLLRKIVCSRRNHSSYMQDII